MTLHAVTDTPTRTKNQTAPPAMNMSKMILTTVIVTVVTTVTSQVIIDMYRSAKENKRKKNAALEAAAQQQQHHGIAGGGGPFDLSQNPLLPGQMPGFPYAAGVAQSNARANMDYEVIPVAAGAAAAANAGRVYNFDSAREDALAKREAVNDARERDLEQRERRARLAYY